MRILVVDNNVELCCVLGDFFGSQPDMEVVGEAYDGEQALVKIQELEPDVVILDITMPHLDGLGVLERLNNLNLPRRPHIIILTAFGKDGLISHLTELGEDFFVLKPFNLKMLTERIRQFAGDTRGTAEDVLDYPASKGPQARDSNEQRVTRLLHEMGIPPHFKGFTYLREAVLMCVTNGYVGGGLTKELYPSLAAKHNTTAGGVEAAIRNAVIAAWEHGNAVYMRDLCGSHRGEKVPTNSLVIAKLAEEANAS